MITRGLAGLTVLSVLALAGCGGEDADVAESSASTPSAASSAPVSAADALRASVPDDKVAAYAYAATGACTPLSGVVDAPNKSASFTTSQAIPEVDGGSLAITFLALGADKPFVRFTIKPASLAKQMGITSKKWLAIDPAKITNYDESPFAYGGETDPLGASDLMGVAADVTSPTGQKFSGTLDLTKIADANPVLEAAEVTALGDKAKAVPFDAAIDAKTGNLSTFVVKVPAAGKVKAGNCTIKYSGYDTTKALAVPADAAKAPEVAYEMLNG
ncbi:hypothetical protein ACQP2E_26560 [Actinoplanes sp. CA-015351]|uniref:hypothetical protein n=1 Tax=Actinoplanes sp. CA-015351 TaxID=3239897 RepID=UPI003D969AE8